MTLGTDKRHFIYGLTADLAAAVLIVIFAFYINRGIEIKGLYMDDLYMWSCYGEQSLREFAFPIGTSTRFRPVYWLATYLEMALVGTHVDRFAGVNIIINAFAAFGIYCFAKKLAGEGAKGRVTGLSASCAYLASRFAYYQIGQALGLMETMALMMALFILYRLYRYSVTPEGRDSDFAQALVMYFLIVFTHERYMALLPLFYLALVSRRAMAGGERKTKRYSLTKWLAPAGVLLVIICIRTYAIGSALPAGTGGTEVTDTFVWTEALRYACEQVLYIFGVNPGPEYLSGISWADTPWQIKRTVKLSVLMIGLVCIIFALDSVRDFFSLISDEDSEESAAVRLRAAGRISASLMFITFIALMIGCSSVTIRLEMRWIYVSYAASLIYAAYMIGELGCTKGKLRLFMNSCPLILFICYCVLSIYVNIFYRTYFDRIYFWADQQRMNSLYEETVGKYGADEICGMSIYIIDNSYGMSDFYARTFFKPYYALGEDEGTRIVFLESTKELPEEEIREGKALVLIEIPEDSAYRDITEDFI